MYAAEKLAAAAHAMAISDGSLRERLIDARTEISPLTERDLPSSARALWRSLSPRLTWLDFVSDREIRRLASLLIDLHELVDDAVQLHDLDAVIDHLAEPPANEVAP